MKKTLLTFTLFLILVSCKNEPNKTNESKSPISVNFNKMLTAYSEEELKLNPIDATYRGDERYNNSFPNFLSNEYINQRKAHYAKYLNQLNEYDDSDLSESEKMSKEVLKWECEINLKGYDFKQEYLPLDQMWTVNLVMGQLASGSAAQPFKTVKDYQNWLQRVNEYLVWLATAKEKMNEGMALGYVLPKSLIVKMIPQFEAIAEGTVTSNLFYSPIKLMPESFSEKDKKALTEAYSNQIQNQIIPAYADMYLFLKNDYIKKGRTSSGIEGIPNGKEFYDYQIKKYTTTTMTADEIHQLGLKEVARILSEMEKVKSEVGYKGDLKSFFNYVRTNKELMPFTKPQQVIDNFYAIYEKMKPQLEKLFDVVPKSKFEVKRTEAFRENSSSAEYNLGSIDGKRPGVFYVPIPDVKTYNTVSDEALFLHEAIPGHHYQGSLQQENPELPDFRKTLTYSAYAEGWGLYTESLGKELGLYTNPYQYFGMLSMEMHRAIRLVVDTGLHSKGWTREKAIQYSLDNEAQSEEGVISEVERYMANPGQALSYKIGQLKILELRAKATKELGNKFEIKQFHNQVLSTGCIPLYLLEGKINNWIEISKK
ncbi:DUF885 domain-containing protein [Flavobacterium granuli]|uniref:Uncharacterized protein (DUF885 family) n=1 Tax=Flavobacterium granuli TaxID=280093 RepID=A0ABU1RYP3_9FLAO|nr:DUF885 domain-containing protein [Flavobacterium granuli]MDR6843876.1 uncharacterized protein (DUF885 family) [Flavobacterium granuli]